MLEFDEFELETILVHLNLVDTVFGSVPVRDSLIVKIKEYLNVEC